MEKPVMWGRVRSWLASPWAIIGGAALGLLIGARNHALADALAPVGQIYISLLQMCIIPIIISAVVSSLGNLLSDHRAGPHFRRLVGAVAVNLLVAWALAAGAGLLFKPGAHLSAGAMTTLGSTISQAERESSGGAQAASPSFALFLEQAVPNNIFSAFSRGDSLATLFISILLGLAFGSTNTPSARAALAITQEIYNVFTRIIGWVLLGLPFGLCALFAGLAAHIGLEVPKALLGLILVFYGCGIAMLLLYAVFIARSVGTSPFRAFMALRKTIFVALGTSSSFAAVPTALREMQENLGTEKEVADLVLPVGISMNLAGNVLYYTLATLFISQLYNSPLGWGSLPVFFCGTMMAAMAAGSLPGSANITIILVVLEPLGLPGGAAIILLLAVDALLDPLLTAVNTYGNCALTVLLDRLQKKSAAAAPAVPEPAPSHGA